MMPALRPCFERTGHVIPQVIETKFVVGSIGHIRRIRFFPIDQAQLMDVLLDRFQVRIVEKRLTTMLGSGSFLQYSDAQS